MRQHEYNTRQHEYNTTQHECNASTTRDNKSTKQPKICFDLFLFIVAYSGPGILGSKDLFML